MSISTIQEKLLNKGCGTVLAVAAAIVMGASIFSSQCSGSGMSAQRNGQESAIALVGDVPVLADAIQMQASKISGTDTSLATQASSLVTATGNALKAAAIRSLLQQGPAVTDAEVSKAIQGIVDAQTEQVKMSVVAQGKVKPDASDAEFDKAIKALGGQKTLAQMRADATAALTAAYKDPARKEGLVEALGDAILTARLGEKATSDDQALRDSYKSYVIKRIFFSAQSGAKETPEQRSAKALSELKGGKSFDKLMDELSNDPPPPGGKPLHELSVTVPLDALSRQPELASLKGKSAGDTTDVVDVPGGKAIYQLSAIQDSLPADFDKNKQKYRTQQAQQAGRMELERQMQTLLKPEAVKWQNLGYKALASVYSASQSPLGPTEEPLRKAFADAQAATKSANDAEKQIGAKAMLAVNALIDQMQGPAAASLKPLKLTALEAIQTAGLQDPTISLQLADFYGEAKDGAKATQALIAASKGNTRYDAQGERIFREVAGKAVKLEAAKVITKEQHDSVQAQQAVWTSTKSENAKAEAEAKAEIEKQKKANEAEIARQKAEAAKTSPAPGGTTAGTGTSATAPITGSSVPSTSTQGGTSPLTGTPSNGKP